MKKAICLLAVFALAAPVYGTVNFTAIGVGPQLQISYTTDAGELPRGIALKATVLGGDLILVLNPDTPGNVVTHASYNCPIDFAFSNQETYTVGDGHPIAEPDVPGVLNWAECVDEFSICMGVLDQTENQLPGPPAASPLVTVILARCTDEQSVTLRITEDDLRGGVVGSDLDSNIDDGEYIDVLIEFVSPRPACWDYVTLCYGDSDNNNAADFTDFFAWKDSYLPSGRDWNDTHGTAPGEYNPCADFNQDGTIGFGDFFAWKDTYTDVTPIAPCDPPPSESPWPPAGYP